MTATEAPVDMFVEPDDAREQSAVESRVPPHDLESEAAVISAAMHDLDAMRSVADVLLPAHFYSESHRRMYEGQLALFRAGRPVDAVILSTWLRDHNRLAQVGGMAYVTTVTNDAPCSRNARAYADAVIEVWRRRQLITLGQRLSAQGYCNSQADDLVRMTDTEIATLRAAPAASVVDPADPLRGLEHLSRVAITGRQALHALAARPVHYVWALIAVAGTIILLAGGPGEGKTTLLFLLLAARMNKGSAVNVLGRLVEPALPGTYLVLIEGEHSESSAARKLLRSLRLLGIDDGALDRVILVARKAVRLGSPEWLDVVKLVGAGLVSDIGIDTVARVAPADGDNEREQTAIFDVVAQAIEAAPTEETKPTVWAAAHTRKNNRSGDVSDVAGSVQRVGQADSVLMLAGEKVEGRTVASKVTFGKLREEPEVYPLPVTFSIVGETIRVTTSTGEDDDDRPLETRIVEQLQHGKKTKTALSTALGRNGDDIEGALTNLFATRQIGTAAVTIRGRPYKAFALRTTPDSTPDPASRQTTPDSRETVS
jgi:hypothetical protein